jgi:hypothetical protein
MTSVRNATTYDPVLKRHRATCPTCGYAAVRAKRDAAAHVLAQHIAYAHDGKPCAEVAR